MTGSSGRGVFSVGRLEGRYLVPKEHPAPDSVRARLDAVALHSLHAAVTALNPLWSTGDGVCLVRRLDIEVDVDAAWEPGVLARRWAMQIARKLSDAIRSRDNSNDDFVYFDSSPAYLSTFLADLAAGKAWSKWYYRSFDGLRILPPSQALRTAILRDPSAGLEALGLLSPTGLAALLRAMSRNDAMRTLDGLAQGHVSTTSLAQCLEAIHAALDARSEGPPVDETAEARMALGLYVLACAHDSSLAGETLERAARAVARLAARLARGAWGDNALVAALQCRDIAHVYLVAGPADAEILSPLLGAAESQVRLLAAMLQSRSVSAGSTTQAGSTDEPRISTTRFGGACLLLPMIDRLPLAELTVNWPDPEGVSPVALLRHILLVCCLGVQRAEEAFFDPTLRELTGFGSALLPADASSWLAKVGAWRLDRLLEGVRERWSERGAIGGEEMLLVPVRWGDRRARPVALLIDTARGLWLAAMNNRDAECLTKNLKVSLRHAQKQATVYGEGDLIPALRRARPDLAIVDLSSIWGEGMSEGVAETLARLDRLPLDLAYLTLPGGWRVPRRIRLALAVVAMGVLRDFAWRLPGFARSSLPYLYENFLDLHASVEFAQERYIATLGRPPLNLILNMTGMARSTIDLSWLDKPLVLATE